MNKERLVKTFTDLVALDSPSFDEQAVCRYIKERLTALGVQVTEDDSAAATGSTCGNLLATIPGDPSLEPVLFAAHMDMVEPSRGKQAVTDENGHITSCGDTVLGADDFAGVSAILEGAASLLESGATHPTLELLFTTGEEHFCVGAKAFDAQRLQSKTAYVMDLSGPVGDCAVAAPTLITFSAEVVGKAAHAGFAPEDGVHAIQVAAAAVANLPSGRWGDVTVNVGTITGGRATNIVPDSCTVTGEIRALCHQDALDRLNEIHSEFVEQAQAVDAKLNFNHTIHITGYRVDTDAPVAQRFRRACEAVGVAPRFTDTYGGSDCNILSAHGIQGLVVATAMNNCHAVNEYTTVEELCKAAQLAQALMEKQD